MNSKQPENLQPFAPTSLEDKARQRLEWLFLLNQGTVLGVKGLGRDALSVHRETTKEILRITGAVVADISKLNNYDLRLVFTMRIYAEAALERMSRYVAKAPNGIQLPLQCQIVDGGPAEWAAEERLEVTRPKYRRYDVTSHDPDSSDFAPDSHIRLHTDHEQLWNDITDCIRLPSAGLYSSALSGQLIPNRLRMFTAAPSIGNAGPSFKPKNAPQDQMAIDQAPVSASKEPRNFGQFAYVMVQNLDRSQELNLDKFRGYFGQFGHFHFAAPSTDATRPTIGVLVYTDFAVAAAVIRSINGNVQKPEMHARFWDPVSPSLQVQYSHGALTDDGVALFSQEAQSRTGFAPQAVRQRARSTQFLYESSLAAASVARCMDGLHPSATLPPRLFVHVATDADAINFAHVEMAKFKTPRYP